MQTRLIIIITTIVLFNSCRQDADQIIEISVVDEALQPYFLKFEQEASLRGVTIDATFDEIEATIENINDGNVVGQCRYNSHYPNEIRIDRQYWQKAGTLGREYVVFHELGHCYLDRGHSEASTVNGTCISIMASGTGTCHNRYSASTREAYLDELFYGH